MRKSLIPVGVGLLLICAGAAIATQYKPTPKQTKDTPTVGTAAVPQALLATVPSPLPPPAREAPFPESPGPAPTGEACGTSPLPGTFFAVLQARANRDELFVIEDGGGGATRLSKVGRAGERTVLADKRSQAHGLVVLGLDVFWAEGKSVLSTSRDGGPVRAVVEFRDSAVRGLTGSGNLLFVTLDGAAGAGAVAAVSMGDGKVTGLASGVEAPRELATDGDTLYVRHGDGVLSKLPATGGALTELSTRTLPLLEAEERTVLYAKQGAGGATAWLASSDGSAREVGVLGGAAASLRSGVAFAGQGEALQLAEGGKTRTLCTLPLAVSVVAAETTAVWALAGQPLVAFRFAR